MSEAEDPDELVWSEFMQRFELRSILRAQMDYIQSHKDELADVDLDELRAAIENIETIRKGVTNTREQSMCAIIESAVAKLAKNQAQNISKYDSKLDFSQLARCVLNKHSKADQPNSLDWESFGFLALTLFDSPAELVTLRGPMLLEVKVRQVARRQSNQEDRNAELVKAEVLTNEDGAEDEATSHRINTMISALDDIQKKPESADGFDLLSLLVHPEFPIQTIENFFDFSFIIKQKQAAMDVRGGLPRAVLAEGEKLEKLDKKQMILSMPMPKVRELARELYRTRNPNPLNSYLDRTSDLYRMRNAHEQVTEMQHQAAAAAESRKRRRTDKG